MGTFLHFNMLCVLLLVDFGQPNHENADYIDPEEPPDDHLTRPNMEYANSDDEVTVAYEDHNESHDHITTIGSTNKSDDQNDLSTEIDIEVYDDHLTTEAESSDGIKVQRMLDVLSNGLMKTYTDELELDHDHNDPHNDYQIEDRIVRYAMQKWHEEI
ncbi:uncharacterized protein LOC108118194 [Drosophila eugracilis]|uniref:uncharacterized protein LOC108118194 n=1 Tax=Drosophila eugracilis TaxID=29029 RepID=UPI0007E5EC52|nr:uncharacterized protein LOC108118194 [Drosophila eugracilis]